MEVKKQLRQGPARERRSPVVMKAKPSRLSTSVRICGISRRAASARTEEAAASRPGRRKKGKGA